MGRLSIIIVNYNVKYYLDQCLYSVSNAIKGIDAEVIVFDNHSRDGSIEFLSKLYPKVTFISSNHNLGFAKANNNAIRQSKGDYILLLNPDTIVAENTLRECLDFMSTHPNAGGVGVRMIKSDGTDAKESRRGIPTPMTALYKMVGLCSKFPHNHHFGHYYMGWLSWDEPSQIEIISGAFCMLRRKALEQIGLLDEDFFMYGEDIDLSYRLLKAGWQNWYLPLRILHYKGESTQKSSFRYVHVFYEAMLIFFRKHYGHLGAFISVPIQIAIYFRASLSLLSMACKKLPKTLGFVNRKENEELYTFIVAPENMERAQNFAMHKGLWAKFHDANKDRAENTLGIETKQKTYFVYDMSVFSFKEIFERFSINKNPDNVIATYYPKRNIIVTDSETII